MPLLSEAFFYFVPYLTLVWVLTILLDIVLLRMGYWNAVTRISLIGLKVVSIVIAAAMLGVPSLLAITTASLTAAIGDAEAARHPDDHVESVRPDCLVDFDHWKQHRDHPGGLAACHEQYPPRVRWKIMMRMDLLSKKMI